jgi:hypothetical protein
MLPQKAPASRAGAFFSKNSSKKLKFSCFYHIFLILGSGLLVQETAGKPGRRFYFDGGKHGNVF